MPATSESPARLARLVVGVTSYTPPTSEQRNYTLPCQYLDCIRAAGLEAVLLTGGDAGACLERLDGLVLAGGGDIDPRLYGAGTHETTYMVDRVRDDFELALYGAALADAKPVLAICRGLQVVNLHRGGSLVPHVPERFGETIAHRAPPREPIPHGVDIEKASRLADLTNGGALDVVSWHHQCVDQLGEGLRVVARAPDGVPEAIELEDGAEHWLCAVQWHPELNAESNVRQAALFDGFAAAIHDWKGGKQA